MLYTVAEVSKLTSLSKVSIYKKMKLKELEGHISKEAGVTYIDEVGLKFINDSLKVNEPVNNDIKHKDIESSANKESATDTEDLTINKELVNALIEQLKAKDEQIKELHKLLENSQVLLKDKDDKQDPLLLEEHFKEIDDKLAAIRVEMDNRKVEEPEKKGWFGWRRK